ncbi:MAG: choice-of-anchor L domain-containing protein [Flavobacteriales bacterium]|nr:choice-of-anchor L domain-containing protein [Flavobacteriales bacterium]MCC6939011.1 choice-of-anchor L domain-containing protein [Flavobacteriales bacterium]
MIPRYAAALSTFMVAGLLNAQLVVNSTQTPLQLVQDVLLGNGVTVSNVRYNGVLNPGTNQVGSGSFTATASNLGLAAGLILSSGTVGNAAGPASDFSGDSNGTGSDADLESISGGTINDMAVLEFDFIPTGDSLKFNYVFASEEYPEFVCSFNDAFGFFLSGPGFAGPYSGGAVNIALVPGTTVPVTINNVNNGLNNDPNDPGCPAVNPSYYVNNSAGTTVAYDGMTVVIQAFALVVCGQQYHIKLAIGDALDSSYDSAVFLEAGSFTSTGSVLPTLAGGAGVTGNTMLEGCNPVELIFTRLGDITVVDTVNIVISGTATAGVDYSPNLPSQLIFPVGLETTSVMLNIPVDPDGPETIVITIDQLIECSGQNIQTIFTFNIDSPPPLVVLSNNINGICGQTHVLAPAVSGGMGQYTYLWSTGAITPTINVSPSVTTTYSVTVSDICGIIPVSSDFIVTLPVYPPLALEVDPPTLIDCLATGPIGVVSVSGGDNTFNYTWTVGGVNIGNTAVINVPSGDPLYYTVTVTDGCGSAIEDSVLVGTTPLPPIEITTSGDVTVICPGDSTLMEVVDIQGGNGVYFLSWTDQNGTPLTAGYTWPVGVPVTQTYTITVEDQCNTVGSASLTTFTPVYAPFQLDLPSDKILCAGDSTTIHAMVAGGSGYYHILWDMPDSLTDPLYWVTPNEDTDYRVTVTDQCGQSLTDEMTIEVEHVFTDIVVTNKGQDDWYLEAATLPYARTWVWDMGDGTRYRQDEVYHSYLDLEEHWVTLKIITPNGCLGADSVLLKPPAHIYFPNAFTPDGDAHNQFFGPVGHYIEEFQMTVFDRWGEVVFTTQDVNIPWDGSVNGSGKAMTGVYVYTYRAAGHYFPPVEGVGHVTLIRGSQD